ncbi:MAG: Uma2 family endonuclease [Saprospiraceae bacterium]
MDAQTLSHLSPREYVQLERDTNTKYEYHDGMVYSMAGGTANHGLVCGNVFGELRSGLLAKGSRCEVLNSEIKLSIAEGNRYLYPDTMVICGKIERSPTSIEAVTNPTLVVEVLSKSTADYDRGDKFFLYRQLPTLQQYVLVEPDRPQVDIYTRRGDLWHISRVTNMDELVSFASLGIEVPLSKLYRNIEFSPPAR